MKLLAVTAALTVATILGITFAILYDLALWATGLGGVVIAGVWAWNFYSFARAPV